MIGGRLKHKIGVYRRTTSRDEYLGTDVGYVLSFSTWADVKYLGGAEEIVNSQIFPSSDLQMYVRYRTSYNEKMRINFKDEMYDIDFIEEVGWRDGLRIKMTKVSE